MILKWTASRLQLNKIFWNSVFSGLKFNILPAQRNAYYIL